MIIDGLCRALTAPVTATAASLTFRSLQLSCWVHAQNVKIDSDQWVTTDQYLRDTWRRRKNKRRRWSDSTASVPTVYLYRTLSIMSPYRTVQDFLVMMTTDRIINTASLNTVYMFETITHAYNYFSFIHRFLFLLLMLSLLPPPRRLCLSDVRLSFCLSVCLFAC